MPTVKSTCCYCGVGCGVLIDAVDGVITGVRGDPDHPANHGKLCSKGQALHLTTGLTGRALYPEVRCSRSQSRSRLSWDDALEHTADRFADIIRQHGPDAVAFYVSGQLLTEDYYAFNKLARALVGTHNIDSNSRLCMSSAVAGYKVTLGADAPPACYDDIDRADCIFIAGSNTAWAHPVLFRRIEAARAAKPDLKLIVVDPRRTATAEAADLHLAIQPGTDVALFNGILHLLIWEGWLDRKFIDAHTQGFEPLKALVRDYTPQMVASTCGLSVEEIATAARWFGNAHAALSLYCMGLNQSTRGTDKNAALINLHLATGQIGRPGAGPFSLTGQPNAMGGRETGTMATLLPGHRDPANAGHCDEIATLWSVPSLPSSPGKTAVEMFEALHKGDIKAVWIACTNPAQSLPEQALVRKALERAELVVLQEAFATTETAPYADVLLPATTWGEKEGTVTNSERRISRVRAAVSAPGEARADWKIAVDFARKLEARLRHGRTTLFPFDMPRQIFDEYKRTTAGRDLDITGLTYALLEARGPQQWPFPEGAEAGAARLYIDGVFPTPGGRASFALAAYHPVAEQATARHPFGLITGRLRDQWHGMSRTGRSARLFGHAPEPRVAMNPADLARRRIAAGDFVQVASTRGSVTLQVEASFEVKPGQIFLPMHWGSAHLGGSGANGINGVTLSKLDAVSRQPELKHCAVRITKIELPWRLVAFAYPQDGDALALAQVARRWLPGFSFATCVLVGVERQGVLFRAAAPGAVEPRAIEAIDAIFGLDDEDTLRYDDGRRGVGRRIRMSGGAIDAVRLAGDVGAEAWLRDLFDRREAVANVGALLLAPAARLPVPVSRGKTVCSCLNVSEAAICEFVAGAAGDADPLAALQSTLKCGTQCGSCLPEVKRLIASAKAAA
ncbi:MAG TPA: molybdopterin-dependent oxidoreductase [Burkholderiales bacterium]|nr:molybdopterin-dependent oxidoreductase [Burkholderiales bacterium]